MVNTILTLEASCEEKGMMCRLCMRHHKDFLNIFVTNAMNGVELWNVIRDLLSLEVAVGDGLPDTVCRQCLRKLMEFSEFKEMCVNSEGELKRNTLENYLEVDMRTRQALTEKGSYGGESLCKDELRIDVKEDVAPSEPLTDEETYGGENLSEDEFGEGSGCNVVCVPLHMGDQVDVEEEADPSESLVDKETYYEVDDPLERPVSDVVCVPLEVGNVIDVKEEPAPSESLAKEESYGGENLGQDPPQGRDVCNVVCVPLEMENQEEESSITRAIPKISVKMLKNLRVKTQGRKSTSFPGITNHRCMPPGQSMKNYSSTITLTDISRESFESRDVCSNTLNDLKETGKVNEVDPTGSWKNPVCDWTEYICSYCGIRSSDKSKMSIHISGHTFNKRTLNCERPENDISDGGISMNRMKIHNGSETFKCQICGKEYNWKSSLHKHLNTHSGLKTYKCETCGKVFNQENNLIEHSRVHSDSKPFTCDNCGKGFSLRNDLLKHSITHMTSKPFKCGTCGMEYNQKDQLIAHSLGHTGLKPFRCETCGKEFKEKYELFRHSGVHSAAKAFKCEICGKEFHKKFILLRHLVIHTGLKPFKCELCGKDFNQRCNLVQHSIIHTGFKPFKCETCGKEFNYKHHFVKHSSIHTRLKSLKC